MRLKNSHTQEKINESSNLTLPPSLSPFSHSLPPLVMLYADYVASRFGLPHALYDDPTNMIDHARVSKVREAIQAGRYRVDASRIADAMIRADISKLRVGGICQEIHN